MKFPKAKHHHNSYLRWWKVRQKEKTFPKFEQAKLWGGLAQAGLRFWKNIMIYVGNHRYVWVDAVVLTNPPICIKLKDTTRHKPEVERLQLLKDELARRGVDLVIWWRPPENVYQSEIYARRMLKDRKPLTFVRALENEIRSLRHED